MVAHLGISDLGAFTEKERHHIRTLNLRKQVLEKNRSRLSKDGREELEAISWIFILLDEISEEEE